MSPRKSLLSSCVLSIIAITLSSHSLAQEQNSPTSTSQVSSNAQSEAENNFNLGMKYLNGDGVRRSLNKALEYLTLADQQGCPRAKLFLGDIHYEYKEYQSAFKYYYLASKDNIAKAQFYVGYMLYKGYGIEKDYQKALAYMHKAAEQNYAPAQYELAKIYDEGKIVPRQFKNAVALYTLAADNGIQEAQYNLGIMYVNNRILDPDFKLAFKYFKLASEQNNAHAQFALATMYANGAGVEQNLTTAFKYYRLASAQGVEKIDPKLKPLIDESSAFKNQEQNLPNNTPPQIEQPVQPAQTSKQEQTINMDLKL